MSKYGNRKVMVDGLTFDSVREANRWCELKLMQRAGEIKDLERQVKFVLIPAQYTPFVNKKRKLLERECVYIGDFMYWEKDDNGWAKVVEDTKGFRTPEYIIKRKLMLKEYGIRIREV
jgi:hypothetical protein